MNAFNEYHELAARLMGRDDFPLPLPSWNRDYPHNVGLLSDAEESELAALVLQFTQGMSFESWRCLDMEQRIPWMRLAVGKMEAVTGQAGTSKSTILQSLASRADEDMALVDADEVRGWPPGLLDEFVSQGFLRPTDNATSVTCDACGHDHVEKVEYVESPPGSGLRAYIHCPENGRVLVPLDRLRRWIINASLLNRNLPPAEGSQAGTRDLVIDESSFSVSWRGGSPVQIGNSKGFRLLQELANSAGTYVAFSDLAERLGGDAMDDVTPVKSRLVKLLRQKGLGDLADFIKTQTGHYGLFLS